NSRGGLKVAEDRTPGGRSQVALDVYTGSPIAVLSTRATHPATKLRSLIRPVHTGDIWGWPSRLLWFCASLAVSVLTVTGVLIWWKPQRKTVAPEVEAAMAAES